MIIERNVMRYGAVICLIMLLAVASGLQAQIPAAGTPRSFELTLTGSVPTVTMPPIDVAAYIAEDEQAGKDEPFRFGAPLDVSYNLKEHGIWSSLKDGDRIWRLRIESKGAYSINLLYDQFYMPEGAEFYLYNDSRSSVIGAFTSYNNKEDGMFSTAPVAGDAVTLEYYEPASAAGQGIISVFRVVHAYRNLFGERSLDDYGESGLCNINVNCPEGADWQDDKRGVVMLLTSGGYRFCSGSLINNVDNDGTPYVLTANHCEVASSDVFMFNYESSGCSNSPGPTYQTVSGCIVRADNSASDFALAELSVDVPLSYNPYFNGWDRGGSTPCNCVCIHHPKCDIKKITFDDDCATSSSYGGPTGSHWRIGAWDDGTTEPGSSGSPLFDSNHHIVGQLHGGTAACNGSVPNSLPDYFGKFSMSWDYGSSSSSRLRDWLDPGNTTTVLDGYDPNTAVPSITVTSPNGGETWYVGDPVTVTWTSENLSENVRIQLNRSYPTEAWETVISSTANDGHYVWTLTGSASSTVRVRVSGATTTGVNDISNANFTILQRTITVTSPNGGEVWTVNTPESITWTSQNLTGNVKIEVNRDYSGGAWETIASNTSNSGSYPWYVTGSATTDARIRITGVTYTAVSDISDGNFTIEAADLPPELTHEPLDDQDVAAFDVVAYPSDDNAGFVTRFFWREEGAGDYDSLLMTDYGGPSEVTASVGPLAEGSYEYFIRVRDSGGQTASTNVLTFDVGDFCGAEQMWDDGWAEMSQWSTRADYKWAVKFEVGSDPFILCGGRIGASAYNPTGEHSSIAVEVLLADGTLGMPGTQVLYKTIGSVGNVPGGLPANPNNFADAVFRDGLGDPLVLTEDFYIAVSNTSTGGYESFLLDTDTPADYSVVYDPCDEAWYSETSGHSSARSGNRMIRAVGFPLVPPSVVISRDGDNVRLDWDDAGAPYYLIYSSGDSDGPFDTLEGSTSGLTFSQEHEAGEHVKFYLVLSSLTP